MNQVLPPRPYVVRPGDSLTSIAKQAGFNNPLAIYNDPSNAPFRLLRPNPNLIRPGDQLVIPPSPQRVRAALQARLDSLTALRHQMDALYIQLEREADQNIQHYRNVATGVDVTATIATLFVSLGQLVNKGMSAMNLSGKALDEANKELAKDSLKFAYEPVEEPLLRLAGDKLGACAGTVALVGKLAIQAFLDIQTPSWWAGVVANRQSGSTWSQAVTTDPIQTLQDARNRIEAQRQSTLRSIDLKIQQTRVLLQAADSGHGHGITVNTRVKL